MPEYNLGVRTPIIMIKPLLHIAMKGRIRIARRLWVTIVKKNVAPFAVDLLYCMIPQAID